MIGAAPSLRESQELIDEVRGELCRGIVGQDDFVRGILVGLIAGGHILIEGVPGLGKTRAVNLLAQICQVRFKRLQFTPDLLPADVVGTRIFNRGTSSFETVRGPVFANFVLADEINRAPAKVQSALLEIMQEHQVTIGPDTLSVSEPFHVFATQNPIEQEGTYPLPEAQLDRFLIKLVVGYPTPESESEIVRLVIDETPIDGARTPGLRQLLDADRLVALQRAAQSLFLDDRLIGYATRLVQATRNAKEVGIELGGYVELGASPRASIALAQCARAVALCEGRASVLPDDIKAMAPAVLRHRILTTYYADAEGISTDQIVDQILASIRVP